MSNNEQDSSCSFFQPFLSFCRTEDLAGTLRPDTCEKLSAGLNALLKILLGAHSILRQFSDPSSGAGRHSYAYKYLTSWITGNILRRRIRFPSWMRYIISISTAGTIGLWYIEGGKEHRLGVAIIPNQTLRKHGKEKRNKNWQEPGVKRISGLKYWTDYWLLSGIWPGE
jgi:hypothetical protein